MDDTDTAMKRIEEEATRMGILVEDLLALARLDEIREPRREAVEVDALARDAVDDARATAPDREITLDAPVVPTVLGDTDQLRQVLANLIRNALVHTPPGTPIDVTVRDRDDAVELVVRDHGRGLPDGDPARLFERFWRAEGGRERGPRRRRPRPRHRRRHRRRAPRHRHRVQRARRRRRLHRPPAVVRMRGLTPDSQQAAMRRLIVTVRPFDVRIWMRTVKARRDGRRIVARRRLRPRARRTCLPDTDVVRSPLTRGRRTRTVAGQRAGVSGAQSMRRSSGPSLVTSSAGAHDRRARRASTTAADTFFASTTSRSAGAVAGASVQVCSRRTNGIGPCVPPSSVPADGDATTGFGSATPNASERASIVPVAFGSRAVMPDSQYAWSPTACASELSSLASTT